MNTGSPLVVEVDLGFLDGREVENLNLNLPTLSRKRTKDENVGPTSTPTGFSFYNIKMEQNSTLLVHILKDSSD